METVSALIKDAYRFIRYHSSTIENYPLQTYASALLFSPTGSLTRQSFRDEAPTWVSIKPDVEETWSLCLQSLLHTEPVHLVAFSPDSTQLASASFREVKIWNATTGQCLQTLESDKDIYSMAYAQDPSRVAVSFLGGSVEIWDATNGKCLSKLEHRGKVNMFSISCQITFSNDSKLLAASQSSKVSIWDVESGVHLRTLEGHSDEITAFCFSYDSHWLASASEDHATKIWDMHDGSLSKSLVQNHPILSVTFFRDNIRLASGSRFETVIWSWHSGEVLQVLEIGAVVISASPDSGKLVSCNGDSTIELWDMGSCTQSHVLEGHSSWVHSSSFSHDGQLLASSSTDGSVKIWDLSEHGNMQRVERQSLQILHDVILSYDAMQVATRGEGPSIQVWDVQSGKCTWFLKSRTASVRSIVFSREDPRRLVSLSEDGIIELWDTNTGNCLTTLVPQKVAIASISLSDGSRLLSSLSKNGIVQVWDTAIGNCIQTYNCGMTAMSSPRLMTLSHDSRFVAIATSGCELEVWDLRLSQCIQTVSHDTDYYTAVAISINSTHLAAATWDRSVLVWNVLVGDLLHRFSCESRVDRLFFDTTGSFLKTNYGEIDIAASIRESDGQEEVMPRYHGLALEADGSWIIYKSKPLLYIPSEHRVDCCKVEVLGNAVVIVDGSQRLWMYTFDLEKLELEFS